MNDYFIDIILADNKINYTRGELIKGKILLKVFKPFKIEKLYICLKDSLGINNKVYLQKISFLEESFLEKKEYSFDFELDSSLASYTYTGTDFSLENFIEVFLSFGKYSNKVKLKKVINIFLNNSLKKRISKIDNYTENLTFYFFINFFFCLFLIINFHIISFLYLSITFLIGQLLLSPFLFKRKANKNILIENIFFHKNTSNNKQIVSIDFDILNDITITNSSLEFIIQEEYDSGEGTTEKILNCRLGTFKINENYKTGDKLSIEFEFSFDEEIKTPFIINKYNSFKKLAQRAGIYWYLNFYIDNIYNEKFKVEHNLIMNDYE